MQSENKTTSAISIKDSSTKEKYFIDDDLFNAILAIREAIYQATEVNVTPRKMVNTLLRKADMNRLRDELIERYS